MTIYRVLELLAGAVIAYLLGSVPSAVWIGKSFYGIDVREHGSHNAGATNTIRVLGLLPGLFVLAIDIVKGWFAVYLSSNVFGSFLKDWGWLNEFSYYSLSIAIIVVLGHALPIFAGFKGGKGVATMLGAVIGLFNNIIPFVLVVFLVTFILTRYISLSSIMAAISFPVLYLTSKLWLVKHEDITIPMAVFSVIVAVFIIWTHRKNIKRLLNHQEPKFKIHRSLKTDKHAKH
ncbi:MAG: glycerol-3-phosphate 1-O-acyltransferase PlsY [Bacteroidales bacterium]|nr:glycerol-3-phosphate 1-O-acyltransferase PlsY [Candidatus Scybalousia scybalohippi]